MGTKGDRRGLQAALLGAFLVLAMATARPAAAAPPMWEVRDGDSRTYLFGAVHLLPPDLEWRTPAFRAVHLEADELWVEADLAGADPMALRGLIDRFGLDPRASLFARLPAADAETLRRLAERDRVRPERLDALRPWAAAMLLSLRPAYDRGARAEAGVDLAVTRIAHTARKPVRTFETLEDQVRMFDGLSDAAQLAWLSQVIAERTPRRRLRFAWPQPSLTEAWMDGDVARLAALRPAPGEFRDALLGRRNAAWAERLDAEMAAGGGVALVNVGVLHLVGEDGLPALMAARGYRVRRVQ